MSLPTSLSALFPIPNCSFSRFLPRDYVLVVVGACTCLARWIAVQVLPSQRMIDLQTYVILSRYIFSLDFVSVCIGLSFVTTDAWVAFLALDAWSRRLGVVS